MRDALEAQVDQAAKFIAHNTNLSPRFGIVLGTGSSIVASNIKVIAEFDYKQIPSFPVVTALGHEGRLILGTLEDQLVVAMNGRFHLYEGHSIDVATVGVRVMRNLGVQTLLLTNAAGGLNPQFDSGDIMIIESHIDLMWRSSLSSSVTTVAQRPTMRTDYYDHQLIDNALAIARENDFMLHRGTYASLLGPNYETRAEYRMLRRLGADVAGMSTVPEVNVAAKLGMKVLALSIVTNVAKPDVLEPTSGQQVIDAAQIAAPRISRILASAINELAS